MTNTIGLASNATIEMVTRDSHVKVMETYANTTEVVVQNNEVSIKWDNDFRPLIVNGLIKKNMEVFSNTILGDTEYYRVDEYTYGEPIEVGYENDRVVYNTPIIGVKPKLLTMYQELKKILKEAYALTSYDNEEVSIGTEALIYDDTSEFPVDGYAYATHVWEEGNCGVYHSIKWLENLLKEMVQATRQVHIKDAQEARNIVNMSEFDYDQAIDDTNDINRPLNIIDIDELLTRGKDMLETDNVDVFYVESKDIFTVTVESAFLMPTGDGGTYWEREIDSFESYTPREFGIHLDKMEDQA